MIDRTPPHSQEFERAVLGACLLSVESVAQAVDALTVGDFYQMAHGRLFEVLEAMYRKGEPIDLLTIYAATAGDLELNGLARDVFGEVTTSHHTDYYIGELVKLAARRRTIAACHEALSDLHDPEAEDSPSKALGRVMGAQLEAAGRAVEVGTVAEVVCEQSRQAMVRRDRGLVVAPAITTGFYDLDHMYTAESGDYIILAARPSAGKTALVLQMLLHAAESGASVYFASLEMRKERIVRRLLAQLTGISTRRQVLGMMTDAELTRLGEAAASLQALRTLYIDDRPGLTIAQIMAAAQVHKARHGLGLLAVDHLSLVTYANPRAGSYEGMTQVSKDTKTMARRLGVPTIAVAQLSRDVEKGDRKPKMSDLRDSGSLEQDADTIWMPHRPDRTSKHSEAELCVVKNRDGECGDVQLHFDAERTLFSSVEWGAEAS